MINRIAPLTTLAATASRLAPHALLSPLQMAKFAELSRSPIVIGGCGRSGTSLLLSVLSCHPEVCAIPYETRALCPAGYTRFPDIDFGIRWDRLYRGTQEAEIATEMRRWCEKTPRNVRAFPHLLRRLGPQARFVHLVRDGRDVVLSRHPRDKSRHYVSPRRWIEDVRTGLSVENDQRVILVRYEDIVHDLLGTMEPLCAALALPFSPEIFEYPARATVKTHGAWAKAAKPVSARSVGKWRDPAQSSRVEEFMRTPGAVELLRRLHYEIDAG